jgi:hypothetical protein
LESLNETKSANKSDTYQFAGPSTEGISGLAALPKARKPPVAEDCQLQGSTEQTLYDQEPVYGQDLGHFRQHLTTHDEIFR